MPMLVCGLWSSWMFVGYLQLMTNHHRYATVRSTPETFSEHRFSVQIQSGKGFDLNVSLFERLVQEGIELSLIHISEPTRPY